MKDHIRKSLEKKFNNNEIDELERTLSQKEIENMVNPPKWIAIAFLIFVIALGFWFFSSDDENNEVQLSKEEIHKMNIEKAFSSWDGSHINLEILIIKSLNDPESYKHVSTTYRDQDSILIVTSEFTAKNGFGGTLKKKVVVSADTLGNIIDVVKWIDD